jgi:hypothetical protein
MVHVSILIYGFNYVKLFLMIYGEKGKKRTTNPKVAGSIPAGRINNIKQLQISPSIEFFLVCT